MNTENKTPDNDIDYCSIIFLVSSIIDTNELIFNLRNIIEGRTFHYSINNLPNQKLTLTVKFIEPSKKSHFDLIILKLRQAQISFEYFYEKR